MRRLSIGLLGLVFMAAGSTTTADVVRLASGDELTGVVQAVRDDGSVVLVHPDLGQITLSGDSVVEIVEGKTEAPSPPATEGDAKNPKPTPKAVASAPARPQPKELPPEPAKRGGIFGTGLLETWDSSLTFAFNGSENAISRQSILARFRTVKSDDRDRWVIDAKYFFSSTEGETTQNELRSEITKDWLFPNQPWFIFASGNWDHDSFKEWKDRVSLFAGLGYELAKNDTLEWVVRGGVGGSYEFGTVQDFTPEAMFGTSLIRWNLSKRQSINANTTVYPNLENGGEFRLTSGVEWKLKLDEMDGVSLKLGLQNDYESDPRGDDSHNDLKYYAGVTFDF